MMMQIDRFTSAIKKNKTKILTYNAHPPPPRVILETKESNGFTDERRKRRKKKRERNVDDSPYWSTIRLMVISIDPGRGHSAGPFKASPPVPAEGPKVRYFCGFLGLTVEKIRQSSKLAIRIFKYWRFFFFFPSADDRTTKRNFHSAPSSAPPFTQMIRHIFACVFVSAVCR